MPEFDESSSWRSQTRRWAMPIALVVLAVILVYTITSLARERRNAQQLGTANRELNLSLQEMQNEVRTVSDKLNAALSRREGQGARLGGPAARAKAGRRYTLAADAGTSHRAKEGAC